VLLYALVLLAFAPNALGDSARNLHLHYLPGFVAGSQRVFRPSRVAVLPATGAMAAGDINVGAIYSSTGTVTDTLNAQGLGKVVTDAVTHCLADAGLDAVPAEQSRAIPPDADFALTTSIESVSVVKRFGEEHTVHGQVFTMKAIVRLHFTLSSRTHPSLFEATITGTEDEPPAKVGHEVFFPLETEPEESLSVALSRSVGSLILEPGFRRVLPLVNQTAAIPATPGKIAAALP